MRVLYDTPTATEFVGLRVAAGLSPRKIEHAEIGLANSIFTATIRSDDNELIAMGRIIGDGGCNFQVVDIAVRPDHQGKGLGKKIMEHITTYIETAIFEDSYVSLIADGEAHKLYAQYHFEPVGPSGRGMYYERQKSR